MADDRYAFIGDVHGEVRKLQAVLLELGKLDLEKIVFLGDYVNRGSNSAEVLELLSDLSHDSRFTFLEGNHDSAFLEALRGDMSRFLELGGARTIRSYISPPVRADVLNHLRSAVPPTHLHFLEGLQEAFVDVDVVGQHQLPERKGGAHYFVVGHQTVGTLPVITPTHALIDTGCGHSWGRLTALLWPSLRYIQVR